MLALGVTQLWSQAWVEAAWPPEEPWPIVGQQILVSTLEHGEWPASDVIALLSRCFPELPEDGFQSVLTHMVQQGYLDSSEGLLRIGPQAERNYGRGHYRDLLASFSGVQLLTGRHGSAEVGSLAADSRQSRKIFGCSYFPLRRWIAAKTYFFNLTATRASSSQRSL